jgi:hypothetical protein
MTTHTPDDLGARLGNALARALPEELVVPELDRVRSGARRRHRRTRSLATASCVVLVVVAGLVTLTVARRSSTSPLTPAPSVTTTTPTATVAADPPLLPAYAMLTTATGSLVEPRDVNILGSGTHNDVFATPAVDVWTDGTATLAIRTTALPSAVPDVPEPFDPGAQSVTTEAIDVRGGIGSIAQLDDDQFAIWLPFDDPTERRLVIGRGLTRDQLLETVDAMTDDGARLVPAGYSPAAHTSALPPRAPKPARSGLKYGTDDVTWVVTEALASEQTTLETATPFLLGHTTVVGDRPTLVQERHGRVFVHWIDPAGVLVSIEADAEGADLDQLVGSVAIVDDATWSDVLHGRSESLLARTTEIGGAQLGDVRVSLRESDTERAVCVALPGGPPQCDGASTDAFSGKLMAAHAELDGRWIVFGFGPTDPSADTGFMATMSTPAGLPVDVASLTDDAGTWFAAAVPDDVDVVDLNIVSDGAGIGGEWARQPVAVLVAR